MVGRNGRLTGHDVKKSYSYYLLSKDSQPLLAFLYTYVSTSTHTLLLSKHTNGLLHPWHILFDVFLESFEFRRPRGAWLVTIDVTVLRLEIVDERILVCRSSCGMWNVILHQAGEHQAGLGCLPNFSIS